jgi:hypothetical protein
MSGPEPSGARSGALRGSTVAAAGFVGEVTGFADKPFQYRTIADFLQCASAAAGAVTFRRL